MNKKGEVTLSSLIIAFVFVSFVVGSMIYFIAGINENYQQPINDTSLEELEVYNQLNAFKSDVSETSGRVGNITASTSAFDLLGSIFTSGWSAALTAKQSVTTIEVITSQAVKDASIGDTTITNNIKILVATLITIVMFITILLGIIFKWRT